MKYMYSCSYKDLLNGEVVEMTLNSNEHMTRESLFLFAFKEYTENMLGECLSWQGKSDSMPESISELRGDSATNFEKMEFKVVHER